MTQQILSYGTVDADVNDNVPLTVKQHVKFHAGVNDNVTLTVKQRVKFHAIT